MFIAANFLPTNGRRLAGGLSAGIRMRTSAALAIAAGSWTALVGKSTEVLVEGGTGSLALGLMYSVSMTEL